MIYQILEDDCNDNFATLEGPCDLNLPKIVNDFSKKNKWSWSDDAEEILDRREKLLKYLEYSYDLHPCSVSTMRLTIEYAMEYCRIGD